jgi:octanoyl-[GcvH]:protein N-octanoyltransferase
MVVSPTCAGHDEQVRHLVGPVQLDDPALELAVSMALLRRVSRGEAEDTLRVHRPSTPVVVFGRRDTRLPGYAEAVRRAREAGYEPLIRSVGGSAVAYDETALVIDVVAHERDPAVGMDRRFKDFGNLYADALRSLGIDSRVGAVPGEYCPGAQSVNSRGVIKLIGTAQRVVHQAWLFSALVVVTGHEGLRPVLGEVYRSLDLPFEEQSVGSVTGEAPQLAPAMVEEVLVRAHANQHTIQTWDIDGATMSLAHQLAADQRA